MEKIQQLTTVLAGGEIPFGYDEKAVKKLAKKYQKLENGRVVNLYPIRSVAHEDSRYTVYACPFLKTAIDEQTLQNVKSLIDELEVGHIRYDSVQSEGYDYYILSNDSGTHIIKEEDRDAVMTISDHFEGIVLFTKAVFSPKHEKQLNCHYAIVGLEKSPNEYKIIPVPNSVIGQNDGNQETMKFQRKIPKIDIPDEEPESPAIEKYKSSMQILSIIILIVILIWYFLFR